MKYRIDPAVSRAVSRCIFLTGSTRSGTTIMGQLLLSLDGVEFFHEPPFIYLLIALIGDVEEETWKIMFESYLFEDNHMLAIPGRRLNFNRGDDSSVFRGKTREDIEARTAKTMRRVEILPRALNGRFGFKMPEMLPYLPKLRAYYPDLVTIVMLRCPKSVIASILAKGWYSDEALSDETGERLFRKGCTLRIPYWLPDGIVDRWTEMSELERCCFCYSYQYRNLVGRNDCIVVDYDEFVTAPHRKFAALAEILDCEFGALTKDLLDGTAEPRRNREISFDQARPEFTEPVFDVYRECRRLVAEL
ncbi:MAG: sulfotransferase [Gammaproteobacteria bacterium]